MSGIASCDEEKYVNGSRLSSSLLELQPFKVVVAEAKSVNEKDLATKRHLRVSNNNSRHRNRRTRSSPGFNDKAVVDLKRVEADSNEMPLLANNNSDEQTDRHAGSVSCDNIFDSPTLQIKTVPSKESASLNRSATVEYDPAIRGSSLPKPVIRTTSREKLLESPNHVPTEQKKAKPKKPNRESLRRSRPDIRASQPNLQSVKRSSITPNGSPEHRPIVAVGQQMTPMHDYEELPTDVKILQQRQRVSQSEAPLVPKVPPETGFTPLSFQSQTSPAVPERTKNPRQRLNPLYAGMHVNPYEHQTANASSTQKRPPTRCLRCLVAGVIIAVLFSALSAGALSMMILGYLEPLKGISSKNQAQEGNLISKLQDEIAALRAASNQTQSKIDERLARTKFELIDAVKSLNISALTGPSTADISNCEHKTFGIGSSSSRNAITSGDYFAEKGFVTTGVTCSASTGYVAYLSTREVDVKSSDDGGDDSSESRVMYRCTCYKSPTLQLPAGADRVECSIHYWQCPTL